MDAEDLEVIFRQLTPRQLDVLAALLRHRSNEALANDLGVSLATLKSHLQTLYRLTDVHGAQELREWFREYREAYLRYMANRLGGD